VHEVSPPYDSCEKRAFDCTEPALAVVGVVSPATQRRLSTDEAIRRYLEGKREALAK